MRSFLVLLLLALTVFAVHGLSGQELDALTALGNRFKILTTASPPWRLDAIDTACNNPPFYGLTCTDEADPHVVGIHFDLSTLSGDMPDAIGYLDHLTTLDIRNSCLYLALPPSVSLLLNLTRLYLVNVATCVLGGGVPVPIPNLQNLTKLEVLHLEGVPLGGTLDDSSIGQLPLRELFIFPIFPTSSFGGQIPRSLFQLRQLRKLYLNANLYDQIGLPSNARPFPELESLTLMNTPAFWSLDVILKTSHSLREINLEGIQAFTSIRSFQGFPNLTSLIVSDTDISGSIAPDFWTSFPLLQKLDLSISTIAGTISPSIGNLKHLAYLDLSSTKFSGTIPNDITRCPLVVLNLKYARFLHPLPIDIGLLAPTLAQLIVSGLVGPSQELPASIGALTKLETLDLSSSGFSGTLPEALKLATNLGVLFLNDNHFNGTLPAFTGINQIDARNNRFYGEIPTSISTAWSIDLRGNNYGPTLPIDFIKKARVLSNLDLGGNLFSGPLPPLNSVMNSIKLDGNQFTGTVPASYCISNEVNLRGNKLSGPVDAILDPSCASASTLDISNNLFEGNFPPIGRSIFILDISGNRFSGPLPELPSDLKSFYASNNKFSSVNFTLFSDSARSGWLTNLDLTGNGLSFSNPANGFYTNLIGSNLQYLSLAHNNFWNPPAPGDFKPYPLRSLDLTNNNLSGDFSLAKLANIAILKLSHNSLGGSLDLTQNPSLTQIDISFNQFRFDVSAFHGLPLLMSINARKNELYGSLALGPQLPNLQTADFSDNTLDQQLDLVSLSQQFAQQQLQALNISHNKMLPTIRSFDTNHTGLARTVFHSPSIDYPDLLSCYELAFYNATRTTFTFDESLFNWAQCDCDNAHFGTAPLGCVSCPSSGTSSCGGLEARVLRNSFALIIDNHLNKSMVDQQSLETESCLHSTAQLTSGLSDCKGINISSHDLQDQEAMEKFMKTQCEVGSEGRLCSKCLCNTTGRGDCFFLDGPKCTKCHRVFPLSTAVPLSVGLLAAIFIVLVVVMAVVLRLKRSQSLVNWQELPIWKRTFYRLYHLTTLGNVSILITFVQILLSFTHWDAYAKANFLSILNIKTDGLGLNCLFPFLSDPMWQLLFELSIPFIVVILIAGAVGVASIIVRLLEPQNRNTKLADSSPSLPLIARSSKEIAVEYPALALLTSMSITSTKFFYFGTALTAHQYLFSSSQVATGIAYSQNSPWMRYSEAGRLIGASVPALLIFDFVLPILFLVLCWKVRKYYGRSSMQIYFGSLFETYSRRCFWWEIVSTLKKLSIALVLKSFPDTDATQSALIVTILLGLQLTQFSLNPWRQKFENIADAVSAVILCGALLATRPSHLLHASDMVWYILALSIAFVLGSVSIALWQTFVGTTDYEKRLNLYLTRNGLGGHIQSDPTFMQNWTMIEDAESQNDSMQSDSLVEHS